MRQALLRQVSTLLLGVWASAATGLSQQRVTAPPAPGAISGIVVDDRAPNRPLANVVVTLRAIDSVTERDQVLTDARGRFVFAEVAAPQRYELSAEKAGYIYGWLGGVRRGLSGTEIQLEAGQWQNAIKLVLVRPSTISGSVTDERGEAVVGAYVRVLKQLRVDGEAALAAGPFVTTDDRGAYRIAGLEEGRYVVSVPSVQDAVPAGTPLADPPNFEAIRGQIAGTPFDGSAIEVDSATHLVVGNYLTPPPRTSAQGLAYPMLFYPAGRTIAEASTIELGVGEDRSGVDLQLRPASTSRVSGTVTGPPGSMTNLVLRLMPQGLERLGFGSEAATALVGSDGRFTFLNVPSGHYTVMASHTVSERTYRPISGTWFTGLPDPPTTRRGGFQSTGETTTYYDLGDMNFWGQTEIDVEGRDLTNVVVALRRGIALSGRAVWEETGGAAGASTRQRPPPALAGVGADPAAFTAGPAIGRTDVKDRSIFALRGLRPTSYFLRMYELQGAMVKSIVWNGRDYTDTPFDASAGSDIENVLVTFTTRKITVTGSVANAQSTANGVVVLVFPPERERWSARGSSRRFLSIPVGMDGSYLSRAVPSGTHLLVAIDRSRAESWRDPHFLEAASLAATKVAVDWGQSVAINLPLSDVR
jgi:hypothetical protein